MAEGGFHGDELTAEGRQDLVIGLIGAIGTRLDRVETAVQKTLQDYAYRYELVKLSDFIKQLPQYSDLDKKRMPRRDYYMKAINGGNEIRELLNDKSALAQWAAVDIHQKRCSSLAKFERARCFVIDQIKCPEEVRFLRELYGSLFYCVAVYADEHQRETYLTREFQQKGKTEKIGELDPAMAARFIMGRDYKEKSEMGQDVQGAYVEADYFIRSDQNSDVQPAIARFFSLIFDKPYVSPTKSEIAMMHAKTAALRSADLSRQTGAAIVSRDGQLLATGCNEVPKAGGGQYWEGDIDDARDFQIGYDANDRKKREALQQLLDKLDNEIKGEYLKGGTSALLEDLEKEKRFSGTLMDSLIEFGRIVHAEQAAMNSACLVSVALRDSDLYCTTYPCHMCARQIINVGIRNVFYIEPYPKSAAVELYEDSIEANPRLSRGDYLRRLNEPKLEPGSKVYFIAFEGVSPRRYEDLFTNGRRKTETGDAIYPNPLTALPRLAPRFASPDAAERIVSDRMHPLIEKWKGGTPPADEGTVERASS